MSKPAGTPIRLAVLLSGSGTTLENLFSLREPPRDPSEFPAEVVFVLSSRTGVKGLERAEKRGVPTEVVRRKDHADLQSYSNAVFDAIRPYNPDLICLAGYMTLLAVPDDFENRIMNIHPALLPSFGGKGYYGEHVHRAVLEHGCKLTGCTAHFVDNEYDHGPIIAQMAVEVNENDDVDALAHRVQAAERQLYPVAIRLFADGRLSVEGRKVRIRPA